MYWDCKLKSYFCVKLYTMKKFLGLLVIMVMLNGCDDGKLTVNTINFDSVTASSCGEIVYKLNNNEALFIKIPADRNAYANDPTPADTPLEIPISSTVIVKYRFYNGKVVSDNLCTLPAPISPSATDEWNATSGTIEIATAPVYAVPNATTGQSKIVKYNHHIILKNVVFLKPDGSNQKYDSFTFGDYLTDATTLLFNFDPTLVGECSSNTKIYNARPNGIESLVIENIDSNLINNTVGTTTQLIGDTTNKLVYRLYSTSLPSVVSDHFCVTTEPTTPAISELWTGVSGVANVSGSIEVTTTTFGTGFSHSIRLKNVTFKKDNSTFYYGNDILYGVLLTN